MTPQEIKKIAIFAHFDKQNIIDDYVVIYLEKLKEVVDEIIFVSDGAIEAEELSKINHLILASICAKHGEYDFGSYKRGFFYIKEEHPEKFNQLDELIFANDSCYCVGDFKKIFAEMQNKQCDSWALASDYHDGNYYLQSYFFALRKMVFLEKFVEDFFKNVTRLQSKKKIIHQYEIGFSKLILQNKKTIFAFFSEEKLLNYISINHQKSLEELKILVEQSQKISFEKIIGKTLNKTRLNFVHSNQFYFLLRLNFPLIKRAIIDEKITSFDDQKITFFWQEILNKYSAGFDSSLIEKHLLRIGTKAKSAKAIRKINLIKLLFSKIFSAKFFFSYKKTRKGFCVIKILRIPIFYKKI